jgi:serine/threonine protein kinase
VHVSPFVEGVSWEDDVDRSLPQCLEMALQYASLMALLEEHGISHGDQDINNFRIAPDGEISLIDWDGYSSTDPTVPTPNTIGHWRMLAPELRNSTGITPNRETDRFAMAGIFSLLINNRFVTDGLADDPAEVDDYMTRGYWPEKDRVLEPDELAISAIGQQLQDLFDLGFSLDPQARPSPDTWRRALTRALHNCWIHDCGQAFVSDAGKTRCPGCGQTVEVQAATRTLKIEIQDSGARFSSEILERQPIILGRATIPNLPGTVSGQHLQITPHADRLLLRHIGRYDTLIQHMGDWYLLDQHWVRQDDLASQAVNLRIANVAVTLTIR